jgi:hypothetical protein
MTVAMVATEEASTLIGPVSLLDSGRVKAALVTRLGVHKAVSSHSAAPLKLPVLSPKTFQHRNTNQQYIMSQKRKHTELADGEASAPKPVKKQRSFKPGTSHPDKKRRRPQVSQDIEKGTSNNALKSRIRDLKRLLVHVDHVGDHKMSASTRIERERELAACEHELAENIEASREAAYKQKMISKYHQVRFFGTAI